MSDRIEQEAIDTRWMRKAVRHAARAWGKTTPNPLVGAIVVKGDSNWAGWHKEAGGPHAEINALQAAQQEACGASLYVTLEPCSTYGRTPPCTKAIIDSGIRRVVIGSLDPNPEHAGRGLKILEDAGLEVAHGIESDACQKLNESFNCWIRYQRPYVLLKMAMTLDGRIATASGHSQWITGSAARKRVQKLRQWADAIMVGGETVRKDDPQLLVRSPKEWKRQPLRLIASSSKELTAGNYQVFTDNLAETRIVTCSGHVEWTSYLERLGEEGITSLLVEGGGELAGLLIQLGLVDKIAFFIAPKILTGTDSRPVVGGKAPMSLEEAKSLNDVELSRCGEDFLITGYLSDVHRYC